MNMSNDKFTKLSETVKKLEETLAKLNTSKTDDRVGSKEAGAEEEAKPLSTDKRQSLPSDVFAVPGKRKLPIDTCARVRNAMARFNQTEGLTESERRTAYNKIIQAAKKCGIDSTGFQEKYGK